MAGSEHSELYDCAFGISHAIGKYSRTVLEHLSQFDSWLEIEYSMNKRPMLCQSMAL